LGLCREKARPALAPARGMRYNSIDKTALYEARNGSWEMLGICPYRSGGGPAPLCLWSGFIRERGVLMLTNVVFDIGNVLLEYNPRRLLARLCSDTAAQDAVMAALFDSPEWVRSDEGTITQQELLETALARVPQYEDLLRRAFCDWLGDMTPIAGMEELVRQLRERGLRLYLLSNFGVRFYEIGDRLPILNQMQGRIISCDWKLLKPQRAIYELLLRRFQLAPEQTLFIDDRPENVEGAIRVGMRAWPFTGAEDLRARLRREGLLPG
jgi:putative hydrolase of the HAD superfamily